MKNEEFISAFNAYIEHERGLTEDTIASYNEDLKRFNNHLKGLSFKTLDQKDIEEYLKFLNDEKLSTKSISRHISSLRTFYKFLNRNNYFSNNPMDGIDSPKIPKHLPDTLTIDEVNNLLEIKLITPNDYRNKAILELLYATGIRISELVTLEFVNLDRENELLRVMGKGRKERIVPIGEVAMEHLNIYLNNYRNKFVKKITNNYMFLNYRGGKLTRQGIFKIIKDECFKSGINKNVSPHTLRHSFATHLLNNGADLRIIQELLGHDNISTTEIYTHLAQDQIKSDYDEFHPRSHYLK